MCSPAKERNGTRWREAKIGYDREPAATKVADPENACGRFPAAATGKPLWRQVAVAEELELGFGREYTAQVGCRDCARSVILIGREDRLK